MNPASHFDMLLLSSQDLTIRLDGKYQPASAAESGKILPLRGDK
jgi:hypothetical protein